ncbi:hypothetical protein IMG5_072560 [Ichthyophthirius multifiliis]|uniref:Transmembrane protein n=1 Tax=Ichthyophthirius multifiliis TaxID=5932 RepID=G0QPY0_ICHMU|nr:hypothetical protein IMG5_072560 [Ichthyophthirius multifiliis]EGR32728.1 hypothetical protein IMG5_072560 [Ichthyophthirius multifiliis]|eukprot:XP_004036714.1 hypothetical protein IMG5_072560 [Ichthyophthirius multifiliis]
MNLINQVQMKQIKQQKASVNQIQTNKLLTKFNQAHIKQFNQLEKMLLVLFIQLRKEKNLKKSKYIRLQSIPVLQVFTNLLQKCKVYVLLWNLQKGLI